jgi:GNAT superfamily N-acetyltransferase
MGYIEPMATAEEGLAAAGIKKAGVASIHLRRPTTAEIPAVVELLNSNLGLGLYTVERFFEMMADSMVMVQLAEVGAGLAGAAVSALMGTEDAGYYQPFGESARQVFYRPPVGTLTALAVSPAARRRGVGRALALESVSWCRNHGCRDIVAVSWLSGGTGTSGPLFASLEFTKGEVVPDFYRSESLRDGWECPVCGPGGCRCAGQFVHLSLAT